MHCTLLVSTAVLMHTGDVLSAGSWGSPRTQHVTSSGVLQLLTRSVPKVFGLPTSGSPGTASNPGGIFFRLSAVLPPLWGGPVVAICNRVLFLLCWHSASRRYSARRTTLWSRASSSRVGYASAQLWRPRACSAIKTATLTRRNAHTHASALSPRRPLWICRSKCPPRRGTRRW